ARRESTMHRFMLLSALFSLVEYEGQLGPMLMAAGDPDPIIVRLLLEDGANPRYKGANRRPDTAGCACTAHRQGDSVPTLMPIRGPHTGSPTLTPRSSI